MAISYEENDNLSRIVFASLIDNPFSIRAGLPVFKGEQLLGLPVYIPGQKTLPEQGLLFKERICLTKGSSSL